MAEVARDLGAAGVKTVLESSLASFQRTVTAEVELVIVALPEDEPEPGELIRTIRARYSAAPILVVSGRQRIEARIALLNAGGTQVIEAPYHPAELVARARALRRRYANSLL